MITGSRVLLVAFLSVCLVLPQWLLPAIDADVGAWALAHASPPCSQDCPASEIDPSTGCCKPKPKKKSSGGGKKKPSTAPTAPDGQSGGQCYKNGTCNGGLTCNRRNRCVQPGVMGGPCRSGNSCDPYLSCSAGTCNAIGEGDPGGRCYPNGTCNRGSVCINNNTMCEDKEVVQQKAAAEKRRREEQLRIEQMNAEERRRAEEEQRRRERERLEHLAALRADYESYSTSLVAQNSPRANQLGTEISKIDVKISKKSRTIDKTGTSQRKKAAIPAIMGVILVGGGALLVGLGESKDARSGGIALLAVGGVVGGIGLAALFTMVGANSSATKRRAALEVQRSTLEAERQRLLAVPSFQQWAIENGEDPGGL